MAPIDLLARPDLTDQLEETEKRDEREEADWRSWIGRAHVWTAQLSEGSSIKTRGRCHMSPA